MSAKLVLDRDGRRRIGMARNNRSESTATIVGQPVMQGYLLKKKRKRMQGLARRWFTLSSTGALSYSFHPNGPIRDSVLVNLAFVHASRKEKAFHIDSGNTVMHCKALTTADFDKWTVALRGFIGGTVQERSGGRVSSIGGPATEANHAIAFDSALEAVAGLAIVSRGRSDRSGQRAHLERFCCFRSLSEKSSLSTRSSNPPTRTFAHLPIFIRPLLRRKSTSS